MGKGFCMTIFVALTMNWYKLEIHHVVMLPSSCVLVPSFHSPIDCSGVDSIVWIEVLLMGSARKRIPARIHLSGHNVSQVRQEFACRQRIQHLHGLLNRSSATKPINYFERNILVLSQLEKNIACHVLNFWPPCLVSVIHILNEADHAIYSTGIHNGLVHRHALGHFRELFTALVLHAHFIAVLLHFSENVKDDLISVLFVHCV
mmetsp:Transcript_27066/g.62920  ORF Transcript_27066/g.62920 Transcript_27066/m.62920 type:complete len:204 (+) Transcript_27066:870-1481(+)